MGIQAGDPNALPDDQSALYKQASQKITELQQQLHDAQQEVPLIPEPSRQGARRLLEQAQRRSIHIATLWEDICTAGIFTPAVCDPLIRQIDYTSKAFLILTLRAIHRRRLQRLEQDKSRQEIHVSPDELAILLRRPIDHEQQSILELEKKARLNEHEQRLLTIHQHNLMLYHEMLTGTRPYASISIVNAIISEKEAIEEIDTSLMQT